MVTRITRTIGPSGRDYASFTLAEADVTNIGTSADLVANDEAIVFEADAGTYNESVTFSSTLVTDATRNVTYKPAAGSEHGGDTSAGVIIDRTTGRAVTVTDDFVALNGLHAKAITVSALRLNGCAGAVLSGMIFTAGGSTHAVDTGLTPTGSASAPCVIQNSVFFAGGNRAFYLVVNSGDSYVDMVNCTHVGTSDFIATYIYSGNTATFVLTNCLALGARCVRDFNDASSITGSNNFGGATAPFPAAIQGSPYPITPSTAYDPGAGDFALYVGKNGALLDSPNNDVVGQGVGPSANASVPVTDILGYPRTGATANPGAFEQPQATATITKTIGPSGRDYSTFTLAEADVTNIGGSADLVNENERIVFEADAGTYSEVVFYTSTLITDATRNVTYRAAAGSEHGGLATAGVIRNGYTNHQDTESYTVFEGIVFNIGSGVTAPCMDLGGDGVALRNCIFISGGNRGLVRCGLIHQCGQGAPAEFTNCVFDSTATASRACIETAGRTGGTFTNIINCTGTAHINKPFIESSNSGVTTQILNCLVLGVRSYTETFPATLTGSNNYGGATAPFPVAIQGSPYPITPTTSFSTPLGSGDYAVYMGATGALADVTGNDVWQQGVGPASNPDVPTTDINGVTRSGATCNPGAFEADGFVAPTVLTRTIGPTGRDYASFILAEADVASVGSGADLTFYNEAIVFEADAATYSGAVGFFSTLTTDATRQVTYKPAAGSEHGGDKTAGVILTSTGFTADLRDDYLHLRGIVSFSSGAYAIVLRAYGAGAFDCIAETTTTGSNSYPIHLVNSGTAYAPMRVENCVSKCPQGSAYYLYASADTYAVLTNCTGILTGGTLDVFRFLPYLADAYVTATNCLALDLGGGGTCQTSTTTFSGSNNFGGSTHPWPVALQGTPYPITPTTDTSPGAGDWAIYQASNGQLYYTPDNDVLGKGAGPAFNPDVPAADILGGARTGTRCNPGAFEETLPVLPELPPPGVISVGNSSVTTNDATGKMADGKQGALVRVTVRDTSNQGLPYSQVWISDAAQVPFISAAYKPDGPDYDGTFRSPNPVVTDAAGVAAFYVYGLKAHTQTFQVEAGAPTPEWNASASPVAKPTTGTVGDQSATWASTYSGDQTIDSAWLAANGGSVVTNVKFTGGQVTVTDSSARFVSCTFTAGAASNYAVVYERSADPAGGANSTFVNCTIQGGRLAAVRMHRASMYQTLVEEAAGHGIYVTPNPNAASNARLALCIVRNVGLNAPVGKAGVYLEDAYRIELTGCSLECPHPSSAGGSATYNQDAALHVAAVNDPVLDVYCYTGWIDGTVRLKDGGLGTGPTGMMLGDLFWTRNYDPSGTALDSDCTSLWTKANYWVDTGQHMEAADGGAQINTFTGVKEANVWPRVLLGTVDITWDSAYANLPVTLNSLVPPSKPPTTQPQLALADMSRSWINAIPDLSVTWRLEPEGQAIYIPQIVDANRYYAGQIGWNDGGSVGEPASYNPPLIVVPLVRRDGSPLDLITGPGSPQNPSS